MRIDTWSLTSLQQRLVKNRRAFDKACPVLLVAAGGESSDAPALRKHAAEDRDAGGTGRIAARDGGFETGCEETGAWKGVVGNGPQTVRSRLPARTKRWNWPLSWTSFSQDQGNAPTACAKGGVGLLASLSEVGKRKFRLVYLLMTLFWIPGVFLIIVILWDAFEVMLLPVPVRRRVRVVLIFFRLTWKLWSGLAGLLPEGERRERLLGIYGPLSLVVLILTWIVGLISGFGLIDASVRGGNAIIPSLFQSLYFSGVTFFTIGYGDVIPLSSAMKMTMVVEAGCGLGFLALVIGYLPVLYQLFARREAHVILLDERAGSPPTATTLLRRHAEGRSLDALEELLREWELWSAELLESHMSYPMLSYYRSQFPNQSWLASLA